LHELSISLHSLSRVQTSKRWQQARLKANPKFFHDVMSSRRRCNSIQLLHVNGSQIQGVQNVREAVFDHFSSHFRKTTVERSGVESLRFRQLSLVEVGSLIRPFLLEEVKQAIWDCDSYKSPGPDGVSFGFIKQFWSILKGDFMRFVMEFHRNGRLSKGINATFTALIPKVASPQHMNDFRPISLGNCMYKVLAKILANRLSAVIRSVVSDCRSAFVKGKQILVANEVVDDACRLKKEMLLFKVDFEKAYDLVDFI